MVIELTETIQEQQEIIERIVRQCIKEDQTDTNESSINNLVIHLSLYITREISGNYIETSSSQIKNFKHHEYFKTADKIISLLEKEFNIKLNKNQKHYTTMYLSNANLLDMDFTWEFDVYDENMSDIIDEALVNIKNQLNLDFISNNDFISNISLHFYPALERLQSNQQIDNNPLKNEIKNSHEVEFKCAKIFNDVIENHFDKSFNEHELAYIALHFGTALK